MSRFLQKIPSISTRMSTNPIYPWKQQPFHSHSCLFEKGTFSEKPMWLKKFKLKQAALQKDDGRPTFLKKGFPDKVLYNLTLGGLIIGLIWTFKVLQSLDHPKNN